MIGKCWFELIARDFSTGADAVQETIYPDIDFGLYMVEYDAPPPEARTYRVNIEGRDGTLDLSEWEGYNQVRFNDREVTIKLRDMRGTESANKFINKVLGQRFFIHFDDDPDYYYRGRCESAETETRSHVTNIDMTFTCHPFRYSVDLETLTFEVEAATQSGGTVTPSGMEYSVKLDSPSVMPSFDVAFTGDETTVNKLEIYNSQVWGQGIHTSHDFSGTGHISTSGAVLKRGANLIRVWNYSTAGQLTVIMTWRPEVI